MAARTGRTVDPALVVDIDSWIRYYKTKHRNIVYRNGAMLVLDPTDLKADPVKTIEPAKGDDYVSLLASSRTPVDRRDAAEAKHKAIEEHRVEVMTEARIAFLDAEQLLLSAMDDWRNAETVGARTSAANEVGRLTKEVEDAERALRSATYPHRYIKFEEGLSRMLIDWDSRDERKTSVYRLVNDSTTPKDRVVIVADKV